MTDLFVTDFTVFILAIFVGYYVVWSVTPALHTPLMSVTNAISGIIIVGALIATGSDTVVTIETGSTNTLNYSRILGFIAVMLASVNIFGGFIATQRMLRMFKNKHK